MTGANLHEPKGADTATANKVYVADGVGSGAWQKVDEDQLSSTGKTLGQIPTADGADGVAWGEPVWKDLLGQILVRDTGATAPTLSTFRGGQIQQYAFAVNDVVGFTFHIPHDYKPGSDIFIHTHWAHNGTAVSGNMTWTYYATFAKGFSQEIFPAEVTGTITTATTNIATTPRWSHRVSEVQLTAAAPSASQIDSDLIEVDGMIFVQLVCTAIPTITGGAPNEPFLFGVDLHYQANHFGTKNKAPNFYT